MDVKETELTPQKIRSVAACVRDGYQLFTGKFRKIFRTTWLTAAIYALLSGIAMSIATHATLTIDYLPLLMLIAIILLTIAMLIIMARQLMKRAKVKLSPIVFPPRYWGGAFITLLIVLIIALTFVLITELPAVILVIAGMVSQAGALQGDPTGMPDYILWTNLVVFTLAGFIQSYVLLSSLFPFYYLCNSAKQQEKERKQLI